MQHFRLWARNKVQLIINDVVNRVLLKVIRQTPTWGLYDIAAFKFGYGRKVETIQDSWGSAPAPVAKPADSASDDSLKIAHLIKRIGITLLRTIKFNNMFFIGTKMSIKLLLKIMLTTVFAAVLTQTVHKFQGGTQCITTSKTKISA